MTWARDPRIPELVNAVEAGEILGISRQSVQKRATRGQLIGALVGGTVWVFRRALIEKLRDEEQAEKARKA